MSNIIFYFKETFENIYKNKTTTFSTVLSIIIALIVLGMTLVFVLNINNLVIISKNELSGVQVFLKNSTTKEEIDTFKNALLERKDIKEVSFVSKEETFKKFLKKTDTDAKYFNEIDNPCEDSFVFHLKNMEEAEKVIDEISKNGNISSVSYYQDTINKIINVSKIISVISIIVIMILFVLSIVVVENMIKVSLLSRMREVTIMENIGSTKWFIRWPFIIEGIILGFLGSFIAYLVISFVYDKIYIFSGNFSILNKYIIDKKYMDKLIFNIFFPTGIGVGITGSIISLRKHLGV